MHSRQILHLLPGYGPATPQRCSDPAVWDAARRRNHRTFRGRVNRFRTEPWLRFRGFGWVVGMAIRSGGVNNAQEVEKSACYVVGCL
jgi:hypothetical protein